MTELADTPEIVAQYWRTNIPKADWYDPAKEAVVVLVLDTCPIAPREVFRPALAAAGSAIVLLHNHPSENPEPSIADIRVTRDLVRAGQLLKVEVLDHVIIGGQNQHRSLRELGYLV